MLPNLPSVSTQLCKDDEEFSQTSPRLYGHQSRLGSWISIAVEITLSASDDKLIG
jgi:hypothetical protein